VAKEALPAGTLLKPEQLRWQAWPEGSVVSAYIAKGKRTPEDFAGAVIREGLREGQPLTDTMVVKPGDSGFLAAVLAPVIREGLREGQPLTDTMVVKPGDSGFLAAVLAPGMRAVSVSINATTGISGFVFPGDRVDVILTHNIQKPGEEQQIVRHASETVLSNVRVIAVDQSVNDQEDKPAVAKNVTLEATPKQAEILTLVSELGKLSLSLRSIVRDESTPGNEKEDGKEKPTLIAERPRTYTWDSDASVLLSPPHADGQTVNVLHGEKAETHDFGSGK